MTDERKGPSSRGRKSNEALQDKSPHGVLVAGDRPVLLVGSLALEVFAYVRGPLEEDASTTVFGEKGSSRSFVGLQAELSPAPEPFVLLPLIRPAVSFADGTRGISGTGQSSCRYGTTAMSL
jgi:hypothetical protein